MTGSKPFLSAEWRHLVMINVPVDPKRLARTIQERLRYSLPSSEIGSMVHDHDFVGNSCRIRQRLPSAWIAAGENVPAGDEI